jgi:hypothetical protein
MGVLPHSETGQMVGICLAGASVPKTATLLGVLKATLSKVLLAFMNHGKTTLAKTNSGQKSTMTERERLL